MELFESKEECFACGACKNICPKQAIEMITDIRGFLYPEINNDLCIECGMCRKVCIISKKVTERNPKEVFAATATDKDLSINSASGGAFAVFAKMILLNGGSVCGAAYNQNMEVKHTLIDNINELSRLQGTKYVQSDIEYIFRTIKHNLLENKTVLFSGTPCQVHGLQSYLGKEYENLFLIDIICHGVPSEKVFLDYIKILEKKIDGKIVNFRFRDKEKGWGSKTPRIDFKQKEVHKSIYIRAINSSYYRLFLKGNIYRDNCYKCKYASAVRVGDVSIGDYWGIDEAHPEFIENQRNYRGISVVICNTEKGIKLVEECKEEFMLCKSDIARAQRRNPQLKEPTKCNIQERERFFELYAKGYNAVEKDFNSFSNMLKKVVILVFPEKLKKKIRKYVKR